MHATQYQYFEHFFNLNYNNVSSHVNDTISGNAAVEAEVKAEVRKLCEQFPVY